MQNILTHTNYFPRYKKMHESSESVATLRKGFAGKWSRTTDLRITNALLYQLSYSGIVRKRKYNNTIRSFVCRRVAHNFVNKCE